MSWPSALVAVVGIVVAGAVAFYWLFLAYGGNPDPADDPTPEEISKRLSSGG